MDRDRIAGMAIDDFARLLDEDVTIFLREPSTILTLTSYHGLDRLAQVRDLRGMYGTVQGETDGFLIIRRPQYYFPSAKPEGVVMERRRANEEIYISKDNIATVVKSMEEPEDL